jgi:hypothetical protein
MKEKYMKTFLFLTLMLLAEWSLGQ